MSSYYSAFVVILDQDVPADEQAAEEIMNALRMIKGVVEVEPHTENLGAVQIAAARRDREWSERLFEFAVAGPKPRKEDT